MDGGTHISGTATPQENKKRCHFCGKFVDEPVRFCKDCLDEMHKALSIHNINVTERHPNAKEEVDGITDFTKG